MKLDIRLQGGEFEAFARNAGHAVPTAAHLAIVRTTEATGTEGQRLFSQITRINRTRLKRRIVVRSQPERGTVFVGLLPLPAAWVEPLNPATMDPAAQRNLSGAQAGGGRFSFPGAFVAKVPAPNSPTGYRLAIWKRQGKARFPVSEQRIPFDRFGGGDLGKDLEAFALDKLAEETSRQLDRLLADETARGGA